MVTAIETRALERRFGDNVAVRHLDIRVQRGESYGFLGLNGAGKTTTIRMLSGVLPPTSGHALVDGVDITARAVDVRRRVGVVFGENVVAEPGWSAVRYLRYFGSMYGLSRSAIAERTIDLLGRLRLRPFAERPIAQLSGGNRRKVELARAMLHGPSILFLDEPTRELDIPSKQATWEFLHELRAGGMTLFVSSHDTAEIESLCSRIGVIQQGSLFWQGNVAELQTTGVPLMLSLTRFLEGTMPPGLQHVKPVGPEPI